MANRNRQGIKERHRRKGLKIFSPESVENGMDYLTLIRGPHKKDADRGSPWLQTVPHSVLARVTEELHSSRNGGKRI
jgi:hypothetical protein